MFFGNGTKDFERINKRCESLIIVFFYFFFLLNVSKSHEGLKNIRLAPTWLDDSVEHCISITKVMA